MPHWMVVTILVGGNLLVWPLLIWGIVNELRAPIEEGDDDA